ncbi:MAG: DUF4097 domain-containing protein [Firmicutes bacterium]|nr:DUF4097 domain-containing protein [Bacillota bacterium]
MNEERFLILKMVEEGKITAQEAVALIDALETESSTESPAELADEAGKEFQSTTSPTEKVGESQWSKVKKLRDVAENAGDSELARRLEDEANRFAKNVEEAADKLSRVIEERIEKEVKPALANLPEFLASIPVIGEWVGNFTTITEERQGYFQEETVQLELVTDNGSIEVEGWSEDYYRLALKLKVRGSDEQAARERAGEIVEMEEGSGRLRIVSKAGPNEALHIRLSVPQDKLYQLAFSTSNGEVKTRSLKNVVGSIVTSNGRVNLENISGERLTARTSNGPVECDDLSVRELMLSTSNGRIRVDGFAQRLEARTSNGSIEVNPRLGDLLQEQTLDLNTSNGGIRVKLPLALQNACWLDVSNSFSAIKVGLEDLLYHIKEHSFGFNRIQAETKGYGTAHAKIRIYARTSNGGISIEKA